MSKATIPSARDYTSRMVERVVALHEIQPHPENPRQHPQSQILQLKASHEQLGQFEPVILWQRPQGYIQVKGHGYDEGVKLTQDETVKAWILPEDTPPQVVKQIMLASNLHAMNSHDDETVVARLLQEQQDLGFDLASLGSDDETLRQMLESLGNDYVQGEQDTQEEENTSRLDEIPEDVPTRCKPGQMWQLSKHRILCGDSTNSHDVKRLFGDGKAVLTHADPPYGMNKDGIENDNLHKNNLDVFQMAWWRVCRPYLIDNASVYIWGNAEDLWRLWYKGGLKDSERLTLRNEIVWDKANESGLYDGNGLKSAGQRMYANLSERCMFFMLGEQEMSTNADNYWDGWTPIVRYLDEQRKIMGWSIKDTKRIAGHSENSGCHWFDKSQWTMPTRETYDAWRETALGKAFKRDYDDLKRDYDDLKRDFLSLRAYFDNTHEIMTDIWKYPRVRDDRPDHPTPKPVAMIERIIKSSAPDDSLVYEPFLGSGSTLMACHHAGRQCVGIEIEPRYVDICLARYEAETGQTAHLLEQVEVLTHA